MPELEDQIRSNLIGQVRRMTYDTFSTALVQTEDAEFDYYRWFYDGQYFLIPAPGSTWGGPETEHHHNLVREALIRAIQSRLWPTNVRPGFWIESGRTNQVAGDTVVDQLEGISVDGGLLSSLLREPFVDGDVYIGDCQCDSCRGVVQDAGGGDEGGTNPVPKRYRSDDRRTTKARRLP